MANFPLDLTTLGPAVAVASLRVIPPGIPHQCPPAPRSAAQQLIFPPSLPWPQEAEGDGAFRHPLGKGPAAPSLPDGLQEYGKHPRMEPGQRMEK